MSTFSKIADVLESVAAYVDSIEHQKLASERQAREERVSKLAERYEASTGESAPSELKEKLAALDTSALDHLLKVAKNNSDSPESLGGPADIDDGEPAPRTVKEAAAQADNSFLNWILND